MPVAKFSFDASTMKMSATPAAGEFAPATTKSTKMSKKLKKGRKLAKGPGGKLRLGGNSAEIRDYLSKLQDLVPFVPKDRKLSKLEVIQGVIDYICHLQGALQTHPAVVGASTTVVVPECQVPYCRQQREQAALGMEAENEEPEGVEEEPTSPGASLDLPEESRSGSPLVSSSV